MVVKGARTSLARARMIRSAKRSRRTRTLNGTNSRNTSSRLNNSSGTQSTSNTKQAKQIAMYEEVQKAADDLQKAAKALIELGTIKTESSTATTTTNTTTEAGTTENAATTTTAESSTTETTAQTKGKTEEEQKKEIIDGVKELVEQYNIIYENMEELGGSVNTLFLSQMKKLIGSYEEELEKTGVSMNKNGTLSITTKTLEAADLSTLKDVYCKSNGLTDKLLERAEYIEDNASSTIDVMNRMYGTQTYNKYGTGSAYYGSTGSWYNAIG